MFFLEWQYIADMNEWGVLVDHDTTYDAGWPLDEVPDIWRDFTSGGSVCVMRYYPA